MVFYGKKGLNIDNHNFTQKALKKKKNTLKPLKLEFPDFRIFSTDRDDYMKFIKLGQ